MYNYRAELIRVVDGDTLDLRVDLGFCMTTVQRFRLLGYDAPEMHGATLTMGRIAQRALEDLLYFANIEITTDKGDSFGRWLCNLSVIGRFHSTPNVVQHLIDGGYGRAWDGKGKRLPWDPKEAYPVSRAGGSS